MEVTIDNTTVRNRAAVQATVLTDKDSDVFVIKRRTKQGGPLSSLLFNTVFQAALEDDLTCWRGQSIGIRLGDQQADCLRLMMCDFKKSTECVGLKINPTRQKFPATMCRTKEWR